MGRAGFWRLQNSFICTFQLLKAPTPLGCRLNWRSIFRPNGYHPFFNSIGSSLLQDPVLTLGCPDNPRVLSPLQDPCLQGCHPANTTPTCTPAPAAKPPSPTPLPPMAAKMVNNRNQFNDAHFEGGPAIHTGLRPSGPAATAWSSLRAPWRVRRESRVHQDRE